MTRWENTSVYRALGTLSALPVRALSRLPLEAGKRRCGLSFSQWFLLLGMGAMLCVPHGAWNNLYAVLFALAALLVYWFGCAARKDAPRNIGDLGPAALVGIPEYIWFYPRILFYWCALFGMALAVSDDN